MVKKCASTPKETLTQCIHIVNHCRQCAAVFPLPVSHRVLFRYSSLVSFLPRCRGLRFCRIRECVWVHHWDNVHRNWERNTGISEDLLQIKRHCWQELEIPSHLGRYASVIQQHSRPHGRVTSHELPVTADLSSSQQVFSVQVGEDTEQAGAHLQDLWTDHLIRLGRALLMTAGFTVHAFGPTYGKTVCCSRFVLRNWRSPAYKTDYEHHEGQFDVGLYKKPTMFKRYVTWSLSTRLTITFLSCHLLADTMWPIRARRTPSQHHCSLMTHFHPWPWKESARKPSGLRTIAPTLSPSSCFSLFSLSLSHINAAYAQDCHMN